MGQRLNIQIEKDGEALANAYYHWSAYTGSAAELTMEICDFYDDIAEASQSDLELAVMLLQHTGAGLNDEEWARIKAHKDLRANDIDLRTCNNRNNGLLSITQEGIEETAWWEEGRVTIELTDRSIYFDVMMYMTNEEFELEYGDMKDYYDGMKIVYEDPFEGLDVYNFWELNDLIKRSPGGIIVATDNTVYLWIE